MKGKSNQIKKVQCNEPDQGIEEINLKGKNTMDKLVFGEDDEPNEELISVDNKMKKIIDKFKPEKKNLKTGSLLALLNFQIKTSPFLMASNVNICEVIIKDG